MPIYEVRSVDAVGNPVDGYEVNDTRRVGEVYIPPSGEIGMQDDERVRERYDGQIIGALADAGLLGDHVYGMPVVEHVNEIEIYEPEVCFAGEDQGRERYIEMAPAQGVSPAERRRYEAAEDRARRELQGDEELVTIDNLVPILFLEPQELRGEGPTADGTAFWETKVKVDHADNLQSDSHQSRIILGYADGRLGVEIVAQDGRSPLSSDRFEWDLVEWQRKPSFGYDPLTNDELSPTKAQVREILVALDQHLETR